MALEETDYLDPFQSALSPGYTEKPLVMLADGTGVGYLDWKVLQAATQTLLISHITMNLFYIGMPLKTSLDFGYFMAFVFSSEQFGGFICILLLLMLCGAQSHCKSWKGRREGRWLDLGCFNSIKKLEIKVRNFRLYIIHVVFIQ